MDERRKVAQRAAAIANSERGTWWNGLSDTQRAYYNRDPNASREAAFEAGADAALSAMQGDGRPDLVGSLECKIASYNEFHELAVAMGYPSMTEAFEHLSELKAMQGAGWIEPVAWMYEHTSAVDGNKPLSQRRWVMGVSLIQPVENGWQRRRVLQQVSALESGESVRQRTLGQISQCVVFMQQLFLGNETT